MLISKPYSDESWFRGIYEWVWHNGIETKPRGQLCKEIENFHIDFLPYVRFMNFEARKLNLSYCKKEFLWYLRGDSKDLSICSHAKMWNNLITKEGEIYSNYGRYIFSDGQFDRCFNLLREDRDTRRAVITILQPKHLLDEDAPEICCTLNIGFRIRNNKLNMTVSLRSQDLVFGMGNDLPFFSILWEMMAVSLSYQYVGLEMGTYHHFCHSLHIYERHYQMVQDIINGSPFHPVECPKIESVREIKWLQNYVNLKADDTKFSSPFINWVLDTKSETIKQAEKARDTLKEVKLLNDKDIFGEAGIQ